MKGLVGVEQWAELRREHFVRGASIKQLARRRSFDDYVREIRPFFVDARTYQRTVYRPGEICQFDVWEPKEEIPVGHGQTRRGWVVVACLGYSRAGAGAVIFSKQTPDLLFGIRRCLWSLGALPQTLVWDRQAGLHATAGRPTEQFAAFCGQLRVDWHFCERGDPQAKGVVERLQDFMERSFEPGRCFANELDYQTGSLPPRPSSDVRPLTSGTWPASARWRVQASRCAVISSQLFQPSSRAGW